MIGMGLIEAIADEDNSWQCEAQAQAGQGISGTVARCGTQDRDVRIGRFGWKAENASVRDQSASALPVT